MPGGTGFGKTIISAKDKQSHQEIRCEVYVAEIKKVDVVMPARRINVEDTDTLYVQAFDEQGNLFSSLEGLSFDWRIRDQNILMHKNLRETEYPSGFLLLSVQSLPVVAADPFEKMRSFFAKKRPGPRCIMRI